jgi:hypothetical protein
MLKPRRHYKLTVATKQLGNNQILLLDLIRHVIYNLLVGE